MAQALLVTTLLTIAGLIVTSIMGFQATPARAADHIVIATTMFFFIGTGKELKEKSDGNADVLQRTRTFKSRVFPAAMWAMAAIMVTFIMGGGVGSGKTPRWLHDALAAVSLLMFARAYVIQLKAMNENASLMERYLKEE